MSFANTQTASPNLSLSVVDLVHSTRYVSVDASSCSNSLLVIIVVPPRQTIPYCRHPPSNFIRQLAQLLAEALGLFLVSMHDGIFK